MRPLCPRAQWLTSWWIPCWAASRALVAVAARLLAVAGDEVTLPQCRALVVLAARGPQGPAELARLLGGLPPDQHEPVIAAFRAFAEATGELPQPGTALGWPGP
jgi:hypothetical protein